MLALKPHAVYYRFVTCPNCGQPATLDHLRTHPECSKAGTSFCALLSASKRTTPPKPGPGRGKKKASHPSDLDSGTKPPAEANQWLISKVDHRKRVVTFTKIQKEGK